MLVLWATWTGGGSIVVSFKCREISFMRFHFIVPSVREMKVFFNTIHDVLPNSLIDSNVSLN